jgi:uncharacterized protein (DUF488 family)
MDRADAADKPLTVFTIGHSNHEIVHFVQLLSDHRIDVLADTRSHPYSKYAAQFNTDVLQEVVPRHGIKYIFLGQPLGGRPPGQEFYDDEGYVRYDRIAQTPAFQQAVERVMDGASRLRVALLCSEEDPTHCHRRRLIGRVLLERGVRLRHIRGDGSIHDESELPPDPGIAPDAQLALFAPEGSKAWRSSQSVLGKKAPSSSSPPSGPPEFAGS